MATADALKAAAARMYQEQQDALRTVSTYRGKLDEASGYVQRLEQAYTVMLRQNSDLRGKVVTIKGSNATLAIKMAEQETGLKAANDAVAALAIDVEAAAKDREAIAKSCVEAQASVQDLSNKLTTACDKIKGLKERLQAATSQRKELKNTLANVQKEMAAQVTAAQQAKDDHASALASASAELTQAREQAARDAAAAAVVEAELRGKLDEATATADSLNAQLNEKTAEALDLETKLQGLLADHNALKEMHATLQTERNAAQEAAAAAQTQVAELQAQLTTAGEEHAARLKELLDEATAERAGAAEALAAALKQSAADQTAAVAAAVAVEQQTFSREREAMAEEMEKLKNRHKEETEALKAGNAALGTRLAALETSLKDHQAKINAIEADVAAKTNEVATLQTTRRNLESRLHEASTHNEELAATLADKEAELAAAANAAASLKFDLESAKKELADKKAMMKVISEVAGREGDDEEAAEEEEENDAPTRRGGRRAAAKRPAAAAGAGTRATRRARAGNRVNRELEMDDAQQEDELPPTEVNPDADEPAAPAAPAVVAHDEEDPRGFTLGEVSADEEDEEEHEEAEEEEEQGGARRTRSGLPLPPTEEFPVDFGGFDDGFVPAGDDEVPADAAPAILGGSTEPYLVRDATLQAPLMDGTDTDSDEDEDAAYETAGAARHRPAQRTFGRKAGAGGAAARRAADAVAVLGPKAVPTKRPGARGQGKRLAALRHGSQATYGGGAGGAKGGKGGAAGKAAFPAKKTLFNVFGGLDKVSPQ